MVHGATYLRSTNRKSIHKNIISQDNRDGNKSRPLREPIYRSLNLQDRTEVQMNQKNNNVRF